MTTQFRETLFFNGKTYALSTEPLESFFEQGHARPSSVYFSTACRRGYIGTWEIIEDKLFLIDIKGNPQKNDYNMDFLFPGQQKVFASWYIGEIQIPEGKMLHYEHMGYASIYEKDLFLEFNKGILVATREVDNTKTFDPEDPIGWRKLERSLYESYLKRLKKENPSSPDDKNPE